MTLTSIIFHLFIYGLTGVFLYFVGKKFLNKIGIITKSREKKTILFLLIGLILILDFLFTKNIIWLSLTAITLSIFAPLPITCILVWILLHKFIISKKTNSTFIKLVSFVMIVISIPTLSSQRF